MTDAVQIEGPLAEIYLSEDQRKGFDAGDVTVWSYNGCIIINQPDRIDVNFVEYQRLNFRKLD